jgi:hypothetical protein
LRASQEHSIEHRDARLHPFCERNCNLNFIGLSHLRNMRHVIVVGFVGLAATGNSN